MTASALTMAQLKQRAAKSRENRLRNRTFQIHERGEARSLLLPWLSEHYGDYEGMLAVTFGVRPGKPVFYDNNQAGRTRLVDRALREQAKDRNAYINAGIWECYADGEPIEEGADAEWGLSLDHYKPVGWPFLAQDIDAPSAVNELLFKRLRGKRHSIVKSGSRDEKGKEAIHFRLPLEDIIPTPEEYRSLNMDLKDDLGADSSPAAPAAWLRLPEMISFPKDKRPYKAWVKMDHWGAPDERWSYNEVRSIIPQRVSNRAREESRDTTPIVAQPVSRRPNDALRAAIANSNDNPERSNGAFGAWKEMCKQGYPEGEALTLSHDLLECVDKWSERSLHGQIRKAYREARAESDGSVDDEVFWIRPELKHIYDTALAIGRSPWGLFGMVLLRTSCDIPPGVVLPNLTGAVGSLNLFVALLGKSGSGKSATISAGRECIHFPRPVPLVPPGSGHAIAHHFGKRNIKEDRVEGIRESVLIAVDEISALRAEFRNPTSTFKSQALSSFTGAPLGGSYVDKSKSVPIEGHRYRLCIVVGVQPGNADVLFDDADSGWPQRFLWFPVRESGVKRDRSLVKPAQLLYEGPEDLVDPSRLNLLGDILLESEMKVLDIPDEAREAVYEADEAEDGDELDGHALFMRLKIAAVLMWMSGRRGEVSLEDWELAGIVMAKSDATREAVRKEFESGKKREFVREQKAKGHGDGIREQARSHTLLESVVKRYRDVIAELGEGEDLGGAGFKKKLGGGPRAEYHEAALDYLVENGELVRRRVVVRKQPGFKYRRPE
ncbi:hypothetical protein ACVH9Z_34275 [Rhodococcus opacus]|uniref:hypothetical protein n=1 Tax=Rhodococcus opacus TaxID=37919 RepID=UPI001B305AC4|nr:hypothetical protein [Rhodococcus opacus]